MISYSQMNAAAPPSATAEPAEHRAQEVSAPVRGLYARPGSERILYSGLLSELGVRHGFTPRLGGVSSGRFASCNLGRTWGDEPHCADENLRLVAADADFAVERLCQVIQVHGPLVLQLTAPERRQREADGMASAHDLCLGVLSADCVSILLADGDRKSVV